MVLCDAIAVSPHISFKQASFRDNDDVAALKVDIVGGDTTRLKRVVVKNKY
jgi:hypothetical protein